MRVNRNQAINAILQDDSVSREVLLMFLGELIGQGASRLVFDNPQNNNEVIKVDMSEWQANNLEFAVWGQIKDKPALAKWFAPVVTMTRCGRVMIMKRAKVISDIKKLPKQMPDFFEDVKFENFGYIGRRLVCIDYGFIDMVKLREGFKMVTVKQW